MSGTLDPELLRTFLAFADSGSFTQAARLVNRTQSAVSMQMKKLEEVLGRTLFSREGRGVGLSEDGYRLVSYARRMLTVHDEALAEFSEAPLTGSVRIGTPDDYAAALLPLVLSRFAETYPHVNLQVVCEGSPNLRGYLAEGELDLAILTCRADAKEGMLLRRDQVVWATAVNHPVHERDPLPLALFYPDCPFQHYAREALDRVARPHRIAYTSHSIAALQAAVLAGLAVTVIARSSVAAGMRELSEAEGFPGLPTVDIVLAQGRADRNEARVRLADHILASFRAKAA
ncbi:MAG: LysR family transcriptional regulator [Alphaproteobacteria bacterium]|jgi:DNA-binding transcriptional LysR family regulator|nr:LysR family transcriptional regulator [Alphaproteobacteria bacterium]